MIDRRPMPPVAFLRTLGCALLALTVLTAPLPAQTPADRRAERFIDSLVGRMTLDEKVGQLNMTPADWNQTGPHAPAGGEQMVREGKIGSFLGFWGAAPTRAMQRIAVEQSRMHIPLLFSQD